jgi:hypothetical protein
MVRKRCGQIAQSHIAKMGPNPTKEDEAYFRHSVMRFLHEVGILCVRELLCACTNIIISLSVSQIETKKQLCIDGLCACLPFM